MPDTPLYLRPQLYRNAAAFIAIVGSILLWRHYAAQNLAALAAVLLLFTSALLAMAAILLALRQRDSGTAVQGVLLVLWQIGFPLLLLTQLYHQAT